MPRTLSVAMTSYLGGSILALTNAIKVTRLDGVQYGFTSLDAAITVDGLSYEPETSIDASELSSTEGSGVDGLDVLGLLRSDRISDVDIRAGLWDAAKIELFLINFEDTTMGRIPLLSGTLGDFRFDGVSYHVEVRSLSQRLSQQIVGLTSPNCRVRALFDSQCMPKGYNENGVIADTNTLTPAMFRFTASVFSVTSPFVLTFGATTTPAGGELKATGYYNYGRVKFSTGLNINIEREVKSHQIVTARAEMTLQEAFPFACLPGDIALIEAGCDRRFSSCRVVYKNSSNFRAEPAVPGNDAVLSRGRR